MWIIYFTVKTPTSECYFPTLELNTLKLSGQDNREKQNLITPGSDSLQRALAHAADHHLKI